MTSANAIPLKAKAQTFRIQLGARTYSLTLRWNSVEGCWSLDIADNAGVPMVSSIPVVTGLNLLAPYAYLGIPGALLAQTDNDPTAVPTFDNLGRTGRIYYVVP